MNTSAPQSLSSQVETVLLATAGILLLPLLAMQITDEVNWDWFDFAVAALLLSGIGMAYVLAARGIGSGCGRRALGLALGILLLLVWAELAVDLFGSPLAGS